MVAIEPLIKSPDSSQVLYKTYQVRELKEGGEIHKIREYSSIIFPIIALSLMISLSPSHFAIPVFTVFNT